MNFLLVLAQQPLFRLLGAILVLLVTDMRPLYGLVAGLVLRGFSWDSVMTADVYFFSRPSVRNG